MARKSYDRRADELQSRNDRIAAMRGSAALLRALIRAHGRPRAEVIVDERPGEGAGR